MNTTLYKYPRTYHVPWSENLKNDDRMHTNMPGAFHGEVIVVTEKMDGECTTMYTDSIHARSIDSQNSNHPSRDMVKSIWSNIKYLIIDGGRICGENMYAEHSIKYNDLDSYFYIFSTWFETWCDSWEEMWKKISDIKTYSGVELPVVPLIYYGLYDENKIHKSWLKYKDTLDRDSEGYVIRVADGFSHDPDEYDNGGFFFQMAKFVRKNHVQTEEHWLKNWNKTKINKLRVL